MPQAEARNTAVKRDQIKESVRNALWARTAGRCTICNRRLLGDERTYLHSVLLAELAHIIGATSGKGSPRSELNDGIEDTEAEENLLLLCHDCHKIIDHPEHIDLFTPDKLREIKESFERRIEMVTENGGLTRTAALRIGSKIRGATAMASQGDVARTLFEGNYLGLVETQRSGDFTCRISGSAGGRGFWEAAQQAVDDTFEQVHQATESGDVEHISVFAIAPVPLLVYAGWKLGDKTPARLFQKHRLQANGWTWRDQGDPVEFEINGTEFDGLAEGVLFICALTSEVNRSLLPPEVAGLPVIEVRPNNVTPGPLLMSHEQSLDNFARTWRSALAMAEARFPNACRWHLIASSPVTAAIEAGRAVVRAVHTAVTVYEREGQSYEAVLTINRQ